MPKSAKPLAERFWEKVDASDPDRCWPWTGHLARNGYGRFSVGGKPEEAHRVAYELSIGAIPLGYTIDHLCRVRHCENPKHLQAVTSDENRRRGASNSGVLFVRKTHCKRGHKYNTENAYRLKNGNWSCRLCMLIVAKTPARRAVAAAQMRKVRLEGRDARSRAVG